HLLTDRGLAASASLTTQKWFLHHQRVHLFTAQEASLNKEETTEVRVPSLSLIGPKLGEVLFRLVPVAFNCWSALQKNEPVVVSNTFLRLTGRPAPDGAPLCSYFHGLGQQPSLFIDRVAKLNEA